MSRLLEDMNDFVKERLNKPLDYTGGFKMDDKELLYKISTMKNDELVQEANELIKEKSVERKRQLMRLEKDMLVDMVFDLESRNETLVNNLLEVEKMYDKLKGENENG